MINIYGKGDHAKVVSSSVRLQQFKFYDDSDYDSLTEGLWVIGIGNNKSLEMEQMKLKNFRNNIIIGFFGIVIITLLVF